MAEPFLGEIKLISFNFAPKGWALCNGQLMAISQNQALFALLGTTYGGDGRISFGLPNLQTRTPLHRGNGLVQGQVGGELAHTLTAAETPRHNHALLTSPDAGTTQDPTNAFLAKSSALPFHDPDGNLATMATAVVGNRGSSQPHNNTQPYLVINFVIALTGIFPSQI